MHNLEGKLLKNITRINEISDNDHYCKTNYNKKSKNGYDVTLKS